MCKFYSAIVMRNGDILHNENLTSHEDLIRLFNINDSQSCCDKFVRVEFTPDNMEDFPNVDKYKLNVDESATPDWFEKHREYVTGRLKEIVSKRIITSDQKILTGGLYVVKDCIIDKMICATIVYLQAQVNEMSENSQVNIMWGNSQIGTMSENSQVNAMRGNSQIGTMRENSHVNVMRGNSQIGTMSGNSQVNIMWENSQIGTMSGNSHVNAVSENSQVNVMSGNSQIGIMSGNSQVNEMRGDSQVKNYNSTKRLPKK